MTALVLLCMAQISHAQSATDTMYRVRTKDGNEYIGKVISRDSVALVLKSDKLGQITLQMADVKQVDLVDQKRLRNGTYWADNPQNTRYFFSPSGYGLKKGDGYYQNIWIFFNQATVGITDNISIGAGVVPLFLFGEATPVWITPKVSFPIVKDKVSIGAGALLGTVIGADEDNATFGIMYGSATFGSRDRNIGLGLGWAFAGGETADKPTINFNFLHRTSQNWYLLSENYYIDAGGDDLGIISFGARWVPRVIGLDFGLVLPFGSAIGSTTYPIPWLGLTVPFGKSKRALAGKSMRLPVSPMQLAMRR